MLSFNVNRSNLASLLRYGLLDMPQLVACTFLSFRLVEFSSGNLRASLCSDGEFADELKQITHVAVSPIE